MPIGIHISKIIIFQIESDFQQVYPDKVNFLFINFDSVFDVLIKIRKVNLTQHDLLLMDIASSETTNAEYKFYVRMNLLAALVPHKSKKFSKKKQWTPSIEDIRSSILVRVQV